MKKIQPIQLWTQQGIKNADTINIIIVNDDLKSSLNTYYELGYEEAISEKSDDKIFVPITNGNVSINGEDYQNLDTANGIDINEEIKKFVISSLNLILA